MAKRNSSPNPAKAGKCDLCGTQGKSVILGTRHRRCGGAPGRPVRAKYSVAGSRGRWQ